ncbi:protease [Hyalangium rubrum]|uniref:Protease n=1 Tax=Hyalangium rubrum TaxID=3103134 RepID=A0ABU5HAQ5_9BACT|nr:protease [Hyalangium sp. s54d21]MDY7230556.1 protease [Hyalangium sp. s54d21]
MRRGLFGRVARLSLVLLCGACASRKEEAAPPPATQASAPTPEAAPMAVTLECEMSVAPRLRVGEPVELKFKLRNATSEPLSVLTWQTPLEGLFNKYLKVTRDGAEVSFSGPTMKRGDPGADAYVTLEPGAAKEATVEISLAYDFTQPGNYRIEFRNHLMDVAPKGAALPRPLPEHQSATLKCPVVETVLAAQ